MLARSRLPRRRSLRLLLAASACLAGALAVGVPALAQITDRPVKDLTKRVVITCPPSYSTAVTTSDGWTLLTEWGKFSSVQVVDPASLNAGTVVVCQYASAPPGHDALFKLQKNAGAGTRAATCTTSGATATCALPSLTGR